jgi:C4-dicarboxylate transporter DctQ subunit
MKTVLANFWETLLAACVVILTAGVLAQVLLRYAIRTSVPAVEEIVSISFIYTIFLGAAVGMKRAEHLNIDALVHRVSPRAQRALALLAAAGTALFLAFVVKEGVAFVLDSYTQNTTYLNLPMSYAYAAIPGSAVLMLYHLGKRSYRLLRGTGAAGAEGGHE